MSQHSSVLEGGEVDTLITPQMKSHETYAWGPKLREQNAELRTVVARANSRLLQSVCTVSKKQRWREGAHWAYSPILHFSSFLAQGGREVSCPWRSEVAYDLFCRLKVCRGNACNFLAETLGAVHSGRQAPHGAQPLLADTETAR